MSDLALDSSKPADAASDAGAQPLSRDALRDKWANHALARDLTNQVGFGSPADLEQSTPAALAARALGPRDNDASSAPGPVYATSRLDRMRICTTCRGLGIVKVEYNHYVRDASCGDCDGEGTIEDAAAPEVASVEASSAEAPAPAAEGETRKGEDVPQLEES